MCSIVSDNNKAIKLIWKPITYILINSIKEKSKQLFEGFFDYLRKT